MIEPATDSQWKGREFINPFNFVAIIYIFGLEKTF